MTTSTKGNNEMLAATAITFFAIIVVAFVVDLAKRDKPASVIIIAR